METLRDKYGTEMYKTLFDYNERNNTILSNAKIREAIRKVIEEESTVDSNNVTADTFIYATNTQRDNTNAIFTSDKLDKLDKLVDALNNLAINDAEYYESNTATASDSQGDIIINT